MKDPPKTVAYRLREAFNASRHHAEFRHYWKLWPYYEVSYDEDAGTVTAEWRGLEAEQLDEPMGEVISGGKSLDDEPVHQAQLSPAQENHVTIPGRMPLIHIIGAMIHNPDAIEVYFPDGKLSLDEMHRLYEWATPSGYAIINHIDAGLTLTKKDVPGEIRWRPQEDF